MRTRIVFLSLFTVALFVGCEWSPSRDNPLDPGSPSYQEPSIKEPPVFNKVWIETHCQEFILVYCKLDVIAEVHDPEGICIQDVAWVTLGEDSLGQMHIDSPLQRFILTLYERSDELPGPLDFYRDTVFTVWFRNEDGDTIQDSAQITDINTNCPTLESPGSAETIVIINDPTPCFQWRDYGVLWPYKYQVNCYLDPDNQLLWSSGDILSDCTTVCMEDDSLADLIDAFKNYSWTVSVVDGDSNKATSQRYRFRVLR